MDEGMELEDVLVGVHMLNSDHEEHTIATMAASTSDGGGPRFYIYLDPVESAKNGHPVFTVLSTGVGTPAEAGVILHGLSHLMLEASEEDVHGY